MRQSISRQIYRKLPKRVRKYQKRQKWMRSVYKNRKRLGALLRQGLRRLLIKK